MTKEIYVSTIHTSVSEKPVIIEYTLTDKGNPKFVEQPTSWEFIEGRPHNKRYRKIQVDVGSRYAVQPVNPQMMKHRDRVGMVEGFRLYGDSYRLGWTIKVKIRFDDTGKIGYVDGRDLQPEVQAKSGISEC